MTTNRLICDTGLVGICYRECIPERTFLEHRVLLPPERLVGPNSSR